MKKIWEKLKKRYVNKKNLVRIIVTDIIVINLIFAAMGFFLYLMLRKDTISELMPEHIEKVEITYEYTRCIELAELSDMPIDESFKTEIRKNAKKIHKAFEKSSYEDINFYELSKLAYIYTYYGFDTKKLYCELDAQYNEEDKLFNNLNDNLLWIENCGVDNSTEFEIEEGLVNWFNTNIEADYNNGNEMSDYYFVLYSFYGTKISEELQVDVLKEELDTIIGDISNDETDVDSLVMAFEYSYYLGKQDKELEIQITELYGQLSDSKDFWYDLEQETGVLHMLWFLNDYNNAFGSIYNEYLEENLSDMLKEHYERYYK